MTNRCVNEMSREKKRKVKEKRYLISPEERNKGIIVTLPPFYVESPLKLIFQVARFTRQITFSIHRFRIVVGSITESVDVFHEDLFHFSFTLVFGLRRREGSGFLTLLPLRRFFLRGKWGLGPSEEEDEVLIEEEG